MTAPPRILLAGAVVVALLVVPSSPASILDVVSWGLDYVMDLSPKEKRDGEADSAPRNCFCQSAHTCICCMELPLVELTGPGCVHMKYFSESESMAVNVSYGGNVLHSDMIKGPNPDPTCMNIVTEWAQVCARFKDLSPVEDGVKACLQFEPVLLGEIQTQYQVGCFHMGPSGINFDTPSPIELAGSVIGAIAGNETSEESTGTDEAINEAALLAAVNQSAEEGIAFFSNLLGLTFGGASNAGGQNNTAETQTPGGTSSASEISTEANLHETSRKD
ncbi:uncharacterized protein [Hetaerina americana]|uniref:uncharacterized protein n=1 Tax=Hetaerina americana TaxID=62018 RepID=UPI003A7F5C6E